MMYRTALIALAAGLYQLDAVPFRIDGPADR